MNKIRIRQNKLLLGKILLLLTILLVIMSGLTVSGCLTGRGNPSRGWSGVAIADDTLILGSMEGKLIALETPGGKSLWEVTFDIPESRGGFGCVPSGCTPQYSGVAIYGTPVVEGDLVYFGGYNGKIYSYRYGNDEPRWIYPRQGNLDGPVVGGAIISQNKIYFGGADGKIYALSTAEGYKEWEFQTADKIWSTPAIADDTLFIGSFDKKLYAINVTDGKEKWNFETEGAIVATPVIYNNTVYFGSFDRHLYAVNATDGSLRWKSSFVADRWFWAQPVVYNNTVYAGCLDGKVYILDAESGREIVTAIDLGSPISSSPVLVDSSIIIASESGEVWAIDTNSNDKRLLVNLEQKIYAPLCASDEMVYIHSQESEMIYALNARTAIKLWEVSLSSK